MKPRPGADPRAQEIKALKGMVAEQACKLDEQADQIVLLINENIDLRATIVRLSADKEELEVELRLRKKASRKPDIKPPAESGKVRSSSALTPRHAQPAQASPALIPRLLSGAHVPPAISPHCTRDRPAIPRNAPLTSLFR